MKLSPAPRLMVTGLGRSGSSLIMQMIAAFGLPVTGEAPVYETDAGAAPELMGEPDFPDGAVKLLDLPRLRGRLPAGTAFRWIMADRRMKCEQAKSHRKFLATFAGIRMSSSKLDRLTMSLVRDAQATMAVIAQRREPVLRLWFEDVLLAPRVEAARLRGFLEACGYAVDDRGEEAAASVVRPRGPKCFNGFLELQLGKDKEVA